jgi:ubiquinone/menaquinone biosynthesis C-methylase UbiE
MLISYEKGTVVQNGYNSSNYRKYMSKNFLLSRLRNNFLSDVKTQVDKLDINNILDAGCGEGFVIEHLKGRNIVGLDKYRGALKVARDMNEEKNFCLSNIYGIPFKDDSFDLVMALEVIEHLKYPDKALNEIKRVTKKYCLISVPDDPYYSMMNMLRFHHMTRLGRDPQHIQKWSSKKFVKYLSSYFDIIETKKPFPWTLVLCKK